MISFDESVPNTQTTLFSTDGCTAGSSSQQDEVRNNSENDQTSEDNTKNKGGPYKGIARNRTEEIRRRKE